MANGILIIQKFLNLMGSRKTIRQHYGKAKKWSGFCGGSSSFSYWICKNDLLALIRKLGFANIRINFDKVDHPNGPCFALIASRFDVEYYLNPKSTRTCTTPLILSHLQKENCVQLNTITFTEEKRDEFLFQQAIYKNRPLLYWS